MWPNLGVFARVIVRLAHHSNWPDDSLMAFDSPWAGFGHNQPARSVVCTSLQAPPGRPGPGAPVVCHVRHFNLGPSF